MTDEEKCIYCRHADHYANACYNMASDNECSCAHGDPKPGATDSLHPLTETVAEWFHENNYTERDPMELSARLLASPFIQQVAKNAWDKAIEENNLLRDSYYEDHGTLVNPYTVEGSDPLAGLKAEWQAEALREAARDIQALHPGEKKNSVEWLLSAAELWASGARPITIPPGSMASPEQNDGDNGDGLG